MKALSTNTEKSTKNGKSTFTIRESYDNDESKSVTICEVENGYVIRICHNYKANDEYKYDEKEYISKDNPLELLKKKDNKEDKQTAKSVADSISSFLSDFTGKMIL